ncbi:MAG: GPW/gp25 family protein [Candidatus Poribacteria bacterium]|nr:GPW/gp25 family protein [Candidatus Poribacteria bacterium]
MDEGRLFGRSIAFPPRIGEDGRMAWSEGPPNIRESIRIILMTELEERLRLPEFGAGLRTFLFEPNTVSTHRLIQEQITQALGQWEARIRVESVTVIPDSQGNQAALVTINYRLVANQVSEQVTVSVGLTG